MTFNPQTDFVECPHCAHMLDHWTLDLWKCPSDNTVYDASSFVAQTATADETLAQLACPTKGCD